MSICRAALLTALVSLIALPAAGAEDWATFVPPTDGNFTTYGEKPPELGLVKRVFALSFAEECNWALGGAPGSGAEPAVYDITYKESFGLPTDPERLARLYRFFCGAGAYNEQHVYMIWESSFGLRPVQFAEPQIKTVHESDELESPLKSLSITGFSARTALTNSWYDADAGMIYTLACWRGICDASSRAAYTFADGGFALTTYDADPTYDDKVNVFRIFDATDPKPLDLVPVAEEDLRDYPGWE
ncbi:MAG TPA: hypothetical protein PK286_07425 [Devosia sp.]|nr:hypothetical protein [Devosia sp.]